MELGCVREFIGEMHQLKDKRAILWFHAGEILARFDHNLGDADLVAVLKRVTQECIGFISAFLQQTKLQFFAPRRRIKSDGDINEAKADAAFPDCACHTHLFRAANAIWADDDLCPGSACAPKTATRPVRVAGEKCRAIRKAE